MMMLGLGSAVAAFVVLSSPIPAHQQRRAPVLMQQPGSEVDPKAIGWEQRTWAKTDDGACFILTDDEGPDPEKQWFFCSDPADDDAMECELVPEWMGTAPDGGHAVWMCSREKP